MCTWRSTPAPEATTGCAGAQRFADPIFGALVELAAVAQRQVEGVECAAAVGHDLRGTHGCATACDRCGDRLEQAGTVAGHDRAARRPRRTGIVEHDLRVLEGERVERLAA